MSDWQPIETAPKDGTGLLLTMDGEVQIGAWGTMTPGNLCWCMDSGEFWFLPSHWMPLPPPPKTEPTP